VPTWIRRRFFVTIVPVSTDNALSSTVAVEGCVNSGREGGVRAPAEGYLMHGRRLASTTLLAAAAGALLISGCYVRSHGHTTAPRPSGTVVVHSAPPEPRAEAQPPKPAPDHVWVGGYWRWTGDTYVWVDGHWESPRPGHVYVRPR